MSQFIEPSKNAYIEICANESSEVFITTTPPPPPLDALSIVKVGNKYNIVGKLNGKSVVSWTGTNKLNAIKEMQILLNRVE